MPQIQRFVDAGAERDPIVSHTVMSTDTRFGVRRLAEEMKDITGQRDHRVDRRRGTAWTIETSGCDGDRPLYGQYDEQTGERDHGQPGADGGEGADAQSTSACSRDLDQRWARPEYGKHRKTDFAKHIYFVPFGQDNPFAKPNSLVSRMDLIMETCEAALQGRQLQPVLVERTRA